MTDHTNTFIKIIGIGSPFGDDQLAKYIIPNLKTMFPHLAINYYDRPGTRLLELMKNSDVIILVDAVISNQTVGTIHSLENQEIENLAQSLSSHDIGLAQTLSLGRALNLLPNTIIFYGIEGDPSNNSNDLSPEVKGNINTLSQRIQKHITELTQ